MTSGIKLLTEFKYQEQENPNADWAPLQFTFLFSESNGANQSRLVQSSAGSHSCTENNKISTLGSRNIRAYPHHEGSWKFQRDRVGG